MADLLLHRMFKIMDTNADGFVSFKVTVNLVYKAKKSSSFVILQDTQFDCNLSAASHSSQATTYLLQE